MNLPKDRQGFLEDVNSMTLPQLKDLLDRQERILSKKKFIANLPDKGEKSRKFADQLKDIIAVRSRGTRSLMGNNQRYLDEPDEMTKDTDNLTIETLVTRNETDIAYLSDPMDSKPSEDLVQKMKELSVGTDPVTEPRPVAINSYERVIKKVEEDPSTSKIKFLPHRSKKDKSSFVSPSMRTKPTHATVQEESAVYPPSYSHESTKLISVEESVELIQEQRAKTEQLAVERAAQRLAEHFTTKMDVYQPSSADMSYRQTKIEDNDEEDDCDVDGNGDEEDSDDVSSVNDDDDDDVDDEF